MVPPRGCDARAPARPGRSGRLAALDLCTLGAVCTVVLLVSLPCLRDFAVHENERDARRLLPLLSELLDHPVRAGSPELDLEGLLERRPALAAGLRDAHPAADGRTLCHHGYVFALEDPGPEGLRAIRAWPLEPGRTGRTSYRFLPDQGLFEQPDAPGLPGGWQPVEP